MIKKMLMKKIYYFSSAWIISAIAKNNGKIIGNIEPKNKGILPAKDKALIILVI